MNKRFTQLLTVATVMSFGMVNAQDNRDASEIQQLLGYSSQQVEDVSKRDLYSKHFKTEVGTYEAYICGGPIHYMSANGFEEINTTILKNQKTNLFENRTNVLVSQFTRDLNASGVRVSIGDADVQFGKNQSMHALDINGEVIGLIQSASSTSIDVSGNRATYDGIYSDAYSEFIVDRAALKNNLVLEDNISNIPSAAAFVAFSEEFDVPNGWQIESAGEAISGTQVIANGFSLVDGEGDIQAYVPVPDVYELNDRSTAVFANGNWDMSFRIVQLDELRYLVQTIVPVSWLQDANRTYPVVVDPTIDISGSLGGWMNSSTINNDQFYTFDAYNYAGNSYKAWSQWNINSIPVFAGILNSEINMYLNGTGNSSTTETITVNEITTSYGNYTGFNTAVYADLGTGAYTTFTCSSIGNYGYTDLGASADADLQTALSTGEFQIGLWMATNGTTWKRFTTTSSTLRVEYESCEVDYSFGNYSGFGISCFGEEDGSIATTVTGDTNYVYSWTGPGSFTSSADSIGGLAPGLYYLTVTGENSWCLVVDSININSPNQLSVLATNAINAECANDENGSAEAMPNGGVPSSYSYVWDNGETTKIAVMLAAGNHSVTVTDANGCVSDDDIAVDYDFELPIVDLGNADTGYCAGGSIILNAGGGFASYVWGDGSTGQLKQVSGLGSFSITVTSFDGCTGSDSINVVEEFDLPEPDLGGNVNSPTSPVILTPGIYSAYVWSTGSLDSAITVSVQGTYSVSVTDHRGCKGEDEVNVKFWTVGIDDGANSESIRLYPNPATDNIQIDGMQSSDATSLDIINAQGQLVRHSILKNDQVSTNVNVSELPSGIYFMHLHSDTTTWKGTFMKK